MRKTVGPASGNSGQAKGEKNAVLFTKDGKKLVQYPAGLKSDSFKVPDGVETIGEGAFIGCSTLTQISLPNGVKTIGDCAFLGCDNLALLDVPDGVETIGAYACYDCSSLKEISLPGSVQTIKFGAFTTFTTTNIRAPRGSFAEQYVGSRKNNMSN